MPASPSLSPNFEATNWGDGPSRVSNSFDRRLPSQHHYRQPSGHKVARAPIVAAPPRNAAHGHYDRQHYQPDTSRVPDANEWTPPISAIPRPSAAAGVEMTGVGGRGNVPRYTSTPPPPPPLPANVPGTYAMDMNGQSNLAREQQQQQPQPPPPPQSPQQQHGASHRPRRMVGSYQLAKTIGAGSMGKVKLALDIRSNERVAAKVIPRNQPDIPVSFPSDLDMHPVRRPKITVPDGFGGERQIPPGHPEYNDALTKHYLEVFSAQADIHPHPAPLLPRDRWTTKERERRENKDVRVLREIAINRLLFHPNVCVLLDVIVHPNHYYIFQELVSGGQMLDYIISHGRLKEKHARKFARQIASAIDYCHKNSIVHRDLKIENILISSNGNIKIIDFGLSNLYSPRSALSTFCGSLYFAAPELLNAQPYMGPEVDIWSFGVVLYVLVCGKVPFDDQLMPALHAKIKRGHVEYPSSLTAECKHLLSRLLVVQPQKRATMGEVVRHPWMCRGYDSPIDALVPYREPLVMPEQLDENVIREIEQYVGFGFGSALEIRRSLIATMTSDWYRGWIRE
ncbi:Serine/threonine-protein kinase, partial [Spiromyces aspiralis]